MHRWSALKFLAGLSLELVSCVQSRMPISAERREAMRAFQRAVTGECGENDEAAPPDLNRDLAGSADPPASCAGFLE